MLDDDKINYIAYQALREMSHSCRNESNKLEAGRNVTFLDTIYKTRYEINQSNRQKALETLEVYTHLNYSHSVLILALLRHCQIKHVNKCQKFH